MLVDQNEKKTGLSKTGITKEILRVNPMARNIDIAKVIGCSANIVAQAKANIKNFQSCGKYENDAS